MKKLRIALDLDDTIFNWRDCHEKKFNCKINKMTREEIHKQVLQCKNDKNFWSNLPLLETPDFIPELYATKRINSKLYTKACLNKYNLPIRPIYQIYDQFDNKARIIKGKCDVLIDDDIFNIDQCLKYGVPALLINRPFNKNIKTNYRIYNLKYSEIENKYYELFGKM